MEMFIETPGYEYQCARFRARVPVETENRANSQPQD